MESDLVSRLKNLEDNFTERKLEGVKKKDIRRTIVAFANSVPEERTAILYVGVEDNGDPKGVLNPDSMQKTIREICEHDCYPQIKFRCEVLHISDKSIVAIEISHSNNRPHFAGPSYIRKGSESVIASDQLFDELITLRLSKPHEILKWKDKIVTVSAQGKILGSTKYLSSAGYRAKHECRIVECTSHYIRLQDISTDKYLSEPLDRITLAYDEAKNRLMLIVK